MNYIIKLILVPILISIVYWVGYYIGWISRQEKMEKENLQERINKLEKRKNQNDKGN